MSKTTVGRKDDTGKLRWGLLRKSLALPLEAVIRVLMFGASKYGDENWQLVANPKVRYRDALDRHLAEIDKGVMVDPDTGEHHMAHVATNALFLLWFYLTGEEKATAPAPVPVQAWRKNPGYSKLLPDPLIGYRGPVQVRLRNGSEFATFHPEMMDWKHGNGKGDVMEYRLLSDTYDPHGEAGR